MNLDYIQKQASTLSKRFGSPLYVYEESSIRKACQKIKSAVVYPNTKMFYACKANSNLAIMKMIKSENFGIEAVSSEEAQLALLAGFKPSDILYTLDGATTEEVQFCIQNKLQANLGSLAQLKKYGELNPKSRVCIRINPDCGDAHHSHNITGGPDSKFGIYYDQQKQIEHHTAKYQLKVIGLHSHIGSGILDLTTWNKAVDIILATARDFKDLEWIDFGGGLGIPYHPDQQELDIQQIGEQLSKKFHQFCQSQKKDLGLYLEPGRFIVGKSGALITQVTTIKSTPNHRFVCTNSGFHHLLRPILYGSYHKIINCSNPDGLQEDVLVTGNICESGDIFTRNQQGIKSILIPKVRQDDYLAILDVGAYGFAMASNYNSRCRPAEILIQLDNTPKLIRYRETLKDILRTSIIDCDIDEQTLYPNRHCKRES